MAEDVRTILSRYVPQAVLDEAVEELQGTEIAPDWFRQQAAELGGAAKERDQLKARLESIESAPKRKEALKRVGIDYDAQPKYGQAVLDSLPSDDLDNLEKVAEFVKEQGFEANLSEEARAEQASPPAQQIVDHAISQGSGQAPSPNSDADLYRDLDAIPDGDKAAVAEVLEKHGRLAPEHG